MWVNICLILDLEFKEKDWATLNFMQGFAKEQIEDKKLVIELIDKLKIAGGDRATDESLFTLDKALEAAADEVSLPQEATEENPS